MKSECPVGYKLADCSSKDYGLTCITCIHAEAYLEASKDRVKAVLVEHGLKVEVKEDVLKNLQNHNYIKENFNLKIKKLGADWYSVYFEGKGKHDNLS